MNEKNAYLFALGAVLLVFTFMFVGIMHEKDVTVDCIKSSSKQCYSVDDIVKLCTGVTK
jgi:hypothetical protein